jgi:hypothetical protein
MHTAQGACGGVKLDVVIASYAVSEQADIVQKKKIFIYSSSRIGDHAPVIFGIYYCHGVYNLSILPVFHPSYHLHSYHKPDTIIHTESAKNPRRRKSF